MYGWVSSGGKQCQQGGLHHPVDTAEDTPTSNSEKVSARWQGEGGKRVGVPYQEKWQNRGREASSAGSYPPQQVQKSNTASHAGSGQESI